MCGVRLGGHLGQVQPGRSFQHSSTSPERDASDSPLVLHAASRRAMLLRAPLCQIRLGCGHRPPAALPFHKGLPARPSSTPSLIEACHVLIVLQLRPRRRRFARRSQRLFRLPHSIRRTFLLISLSHSSFVSLATAPASLTSTTSPQLLSTHRSTYASTLHPTRRLLGHRSPAAGR